MAARVSFRRGAATRDSRATYRDRAAPMGGGVPEMLRTRGFAASRIAQSDEYTPNGKSQELPRVAYGLLYARTKHGNSLAVVRRFSRVRASSAERACARQRLRRGARRAWSAARSFTRLGIGFSASSAIARIASMNRSHSSRDSDSVGSIISAPGTISGNAVV